TSVDANQAADNQAVDEGRRARQDAGPARPHARGHGGATTDRRTSVRDSQGLDGRYPLPDPDPRQGPNRDQPPRPGLLIEPAARPSRPVNYSASLTSYDAFFHGLGPSCVKTRTKQQC